MYSTARVRITTCTCGMDMSAKIAWWLSMFLGIIYYYIYNKYIYCQNKLVVLILVVDDHWSTIIEESETLLVIETNILPNEYCTMYILFLLIMQRIPYLILLDMFKKPLHAHSCIRQQQIASPSGGVGCYQWRLEKIETLPEYEGEVF